MQHPNIKKYLFDILDAINAIEEIKKQMLNYEVFRTNRILRSAVERELITIGEIASMIRKHFSEIEITDLRKIAATRNIIVHDYDGVNYKLIWNIIQTYLPSLKNEILALLQENN